MPEIPGQSNIEREPSPEPGPTERTLGDEPFGEIARSYEPEFVAKYYNPEAQSFLYGQTHEDIDKLPKPQQHALVVLEIEMMYGTEYAKEINERIRKLWDMKDKFTTARLLEHDYESPEEFPNTQEELALLMIDLYYQDYTKAGEQEGMLNSNFPEGRKEAIETIIGYHAMQITRMYIQCGNASPDI